MKTLYTAFIAELLKLRRSPLLVIMFAFFVFIPVMMALLMYVAQHPEIADRIGLLSAKAQFFSENSWKGYFEILNQLIAVLGIIAFGFITSWVFGREYLEGTLTDILSLPVPRTHIVIAKFSIIALWCLLLVVILYFTGIIAGKFIHIPGWSAKIIQINTKVYFLTAIYTISLSTVVGLIACITRGIVAPLGLVIITVIVSQFIVFAGLGPYFPWSIPGVYTVSGTIEGLQLVPASYVILFITSIAGFAGTIAWWKYADHQ